ncbi:hypothetical protein Tco_0237787 [Tanacetum coccineum]
MAHISDIKLIRTDTTLDLSQKAEKGQEFHCFIREDPGDSAIKSETQTIYHIRAKVYTRSMFRSKSSLKQHTNKTIQKNASLNGQSSRSEASLSQHVVHNLPSSSQQPSMNLKQHTNKTIQKNASLNGQSSHSEPSLSQHVMHDLPSSSQQPSMLELEDDENEDKVSDVEIIGLQKMTTKDVYKLNEGEKILVHVDDRYQLIKDAARLCMRFMIVLLKQPNLCPIDAKDWRDVKTRCGARLMGELRCKFCISQGAKIDWVLFKIFNQKYRAMKYSTKYKLYGLVKSTLDEANNIGVDEVHELEYTEDQILHALDLVDAPSKVHDHQ